jgi:GR25 family glycosyltransferase involved in LPS biosynthesis
MNCKIYYINLDHRQDRRDQFLEEMKRIGFEESQIERISAIYVESFGILGCGLSHLKTLQTFYQSGQPYCMIFEDDFQFTLNKEFCQFLLKLPFEQHIDFDLIMLAGKILKEETTPCFFLHKVLDAQTTSAYLITREFAPKLIACLQESTVLLQNWWIEHKEKKHEYCLDIYWKKLQPQNNWFIFHPKIGMQRESYSDIENRITNYGV